MLKHLWETIENHRALKFRNIYVTLKLIASIFTSNRTQPISGLLNRHRISYLVLLIRTTLSGWNVNIWYTCFILYKRPTKAPYRYDNLVTAIHLKDWVHIDEMTRQGRQDNRLSAWTMATGKHTQSYVEDFWTRVTKLASLLYEKYSFLVITQYIITTIQGYKDQVNSTKNDNCSMNYDHCFPWKI